MCVVVALIAAVSAINRILTFQLAKIDRFQFLCELIHHSDCVYELTALQTLESDHYICVRQQANEGASPDVIIVNLKNNNEIIKRPIKADSAIMHWHKQVIALKAQQRTLQIFDLGQKLKVNANTMLEDVTYWKWFSPDSLGLVTETSVYHWNVFEQPPTSPQKVFERNSNLSVSAH